MTDDDPDDKDYDYDGIQMDTADHVWIDHNTFANINDGYIDSRKDTIVPDRVLERDGQPQQDVRHRLDRQRHRPDDHPPQLDPRHQPAQPQRRQRAYAHLYNNYLQNITSYGNLSRGTTKMVLENSYFDNVNNPLYRDTAAAQIKQSGSTCVTCTGKQDSGGAAFDPKSFYAYTLDAAANVPSLVKTYAGPQANIGN